MKKTNLLISCLLSVLFVSCNDNDSIVSNESGKTQILFSVDEFVPDAPDTRTNCDPTNNYAITWAEGDVIGVFPREGFQEPFVIPADQVGQSSASFDGGYWALKDGKPYNAYYPFNRANFTSSEMKTTIPVSYRGQYQNGTNCCVGAYDYTYSDWATSVGGSSVSFKFHHLGSFLVLTLPIPATTRYTSLMLRTDDEVIPVEGKFDLTATTPFLIPTLKGSALTMTLNNFNGVSGQNATFYMMVPPVDLSNKNITVTLSAGSAYCSYSIESKNIAAAKLYKMTGTPVESTIAGTYEGWKPDPFNGHDYVDLGITADDGKPLYWATCNIGAEAPEDYGLYFAWGETVGYGQDISDGHSFDWVNYKWCEGSYNTLTKYCSTESYGTVDGKKVLDPQDDAARMNWGGSWRMPTSTELQKLLSCTWTRTTKNDVLGYIVEGKNGNSIFLPAAGARVNSSLNLAGEVPFCWSATVNAYEAKRLSVSNNKPGIYNEYRSTALSVRAVVE